jgi:hypothetical protein
LEWKSGADHCFVHGVSTTLSTSDFPIGRAKFDPAHPEGLPHVALDPSLKLGKRTVDRYKHMEVRILKGELKRHFGVIRGTHKSLEGEDLVEVQTSTKAINSICTYKPQDLQERL